MKKAFTLIELIIYIAIVTFVLMAAITFTWIIIKNQIKQEVLTEVNSSGGFVLDKLSYYITRADSISSLTVYDSHPAKIVLNYLTAPQVIIDSYTKDITLGGQVVNIRKLKFQQAANTFDLTNDKVNVTNFIITDISNATATTLKIELNLESVNPSNSKTYAAQNSWTTSSTLRKK